MVVVTAAGIGYIYKNTGNGSKENQIVMAITGIGLTFATIATAVDCYIAFDAAPPPPPVGG